MLMILPTQTVFANAEAEKHNSQGDVHYEAGKYEDAIKEYTAAIELEGDNPLYYENRGWSYYKLGNYDKALPEFNKAIQIDSGYTNAYEGRAWVYYEQGKKEDAKLNFNEVAGMYIYTTRNMMRQNKL